MELCGLGFCPRTNQYKVFRVLCRGRCWYGFRDYWSIDESSSLGSGSDKRSDSDSDILSTSDDDSESASDSDISSTSDEDSDSASDSDDGFSDSDGEDECSKLRTEVYTLGGAGRWKKKRLDADMVQKAVLDSKDVRSFTYVGGSLYWIARTPRIGFQAIAFNFNTEKFQFATRRSYSFTDGVIGFRALGDHLYLCRNVKLARAKDVEIYLLKKKKWSIKELVKPPMGNRLNDRDRVLQYFKNGDMFLWRKSNLYMFSSEEPSLKSLRGGKIPLAEEAILHVPSFVSLRDVAKEESSRVLTAGNPPPPSSSTFQSPISYESFHALFQSLPALAQRKLELWRAQPHHSAHPENPSPSPSASQTQITYESDLTTNLASPSSQAPLTYESVVTHLSFISNNLS